MRTWFLTGNTFIFYLFIFKVSFCGKKSSQSNKEGWENVERKLPFHFFPQSAGIGEEGSLQVLTSLQGQQS